MNISTQPTPNPNSMKITVDRTIVESGSLTFDTADAAAANPFAARLFQEKGVASLFMLGNFVTVTRDPSVDWNELVPRLEAAVRAHLES